MALRLIKILPPNGYNDPESLINEDDIIDSWIDRSEGNRTVINLLAEVELTEKILGDLESNSRGKKITELSCFPYQLLFRRKLMKRKRKAKQRMKKKTMSGFIEFQEMNYMRR